MFKIYLQPVFGSIDTEVFVICEPGPNQGDVGSYLQFTNNGIALTKLVREREGSSDYVKPAFRVPENILREILTAFAEAAQDRGIEKRSESFVKGKLDATEKHLEDMRTLVFKKE